MFCKNWERVTHKDDQRLKVYMLYDRVMRNIQNIHKTHKAHEFIHKRQVSKKTEKIPWKSTYRIPGVGSRFPHPTYELDPGSRVWGIQSRVSPTKWVPGLGSLVPPTVPGHGFLFFGYGENEFNFFLNGKHYFFMKQKWQV